MILIYLSIVRKLRLKEIKTKEIKAKDFKIAPYPLSLGNISKDFSPSNMRKTGLNGYVYDFGVDHSAIKTDNILDITI